MASFKDTSTTSEYGDVSVDDILAEFDIQQNSSNPDAMFSYAEADAPAEDAVKVYKPKAKEADVKLYEPKSKLADMADSAREYVLGRIQEDFAPIDENVQPSYADEGYEQAPPQELYPDEYYAEEGYPSQDYTQDDYAPEDYSQEDYPPQEYTQEDYSYEEYEAQAADYYGDDYDQEYYADGTQDFESEGGYYEDEEPEQEFEEEVIDPRFNLGGKPKEEFSYAGEALDISPDENYEGNQQPNYIPVTKMAQDIPDLPDGYVPQEEQPDEENPEFKGSIFSKPKKKKKDKKEKKHKKKNKAEPEEQFEGAEAPPPEEASEPSGYDDSGDLNYAPEENYAAAASHIEVDDDFPSFKEYLLGLLTGVLYHMRNPGVTQGDGGTMPDSDEDLGKELSPKAASKYYGSFVHSLKLRSRISLVLLLIMAYVSLGLPLPGMLRTVKVQAALCLAMQLGISLLALDVFTGAIMNAFRGRFGADFMSVLLCLFTGFDALAVIFGLFGETHLPLCLLSSLSLVGVLISALFNAKGMRKALRVPAIAKTFYAVSAESGIKGSGLTLLKTPRPPHGFIHRSEEAAPDESLFNKISPFMLLLALLLALIVCAVKKSWSNFLFIFSASFAPAVPFTALLCFALPYFVGSARIFPSGAAIAGWSGLCDIGSSKNLIVTDRDLFPQGSVKIENIRIFADVPSEKIVSYAGTMLGASGCGIASCFGELMEKNNCAPKHLENFEVLAGGGFKGIIDGESVLCGGLEFMRLMNVHVPYKLIDDCSVLLAVDGILYGIFNLKYTPNDNVRKALVGLMKSNRHPIFAIRDFNITPEMIRKSFDVATDGYDFPPYVERFTISEAKPGENSKIAAVVCREGLGPLTHMADTGRSMFMAARINILLSVLSAVVGVFVVFIKFLTVGFVSPGFLLGFALLWALPMAVISVFLKF